MWNLVCMSLLKNQDGDPEVLKFFTLGWIVSSRLWVSLKNCTGDHNQEDPMIVSFCWKPLKKSRLCYQFVMCVHLYQIFLWKDTHPKRWWTAWLFPPHMQLLPELCLYWMLLDLWHHSSNNDRSYSALRTYSVQTEGGITLSSRLATLHRAALQKKIWGRGMRWIIYPGINLAWDREFGLETVKPPNWKPYLWASQELGRGS